MKSAFLCLVALVLVLGSSSPSLALSYKITDLGALLADPGTLPGSYAFGINNAGQIVGDGGGYAFLYTPGSDTANLGTLGGSYSYARGINDSGQVVGSAYNAQGSSRAFLYRPGVGMINLGTLGGSRSNAYGINNAGQVVGVADLSTTYNRRAFLYTPGIGMTGLGSLGGEESVATGINNAGQVVGYSGLGIGNGRHAFLYTSQTGMTDIDTMGNWQSTASGINSTGQIVGSFIHDGGLVQTQRAFLYTPGGSMVDLGALPGRLESGAADINDLGWVVGSSGNPDFHNVAAFLYTPSTGMLDLGTLGGMQSGASAINNAGQIVGWSYTASGEIHAALWEPVPEPTSLLALGAGGFGLLGAALRRRIRARA